MTEKELKDVLDNDALAIIAPAGHGKTEMIVEIVRELPGKQLLLTHTNAGIDTLKKRLKKYNVDKNKYVICTIASFCIKYCVAYSNSSSFDISISALDNPKEYYKQLYPGMLKFLEKEWAKKIIEATYNGVIVDEYQDCTIEQHKIILELNKCIPVRVLGDPLQGIFSFAGTLVNWNNLEYKTIQIETKPWRWMNTNKLLGEQLMQIRKEIIPSLYGKKCNVDLSKYYDNIELISPTNFNGYQLLPELNCFKSVVYITKWETSQLEFCKRMPGVFQHDEKQDCELLFKFAKQFDQNSGILLAKTIILFATMCATGVNSELKTFKNRLDCNSCDFSRIKKHSEFAFLLEEIINNKSVYAISQALEWFRSNGLFKFYRKELFDEMIRSLDYSACNDISIYEASNHIRKDISLQRKYDKFKYLSSRTLLSKGLEFDCVIIDMETPLSAKDFYVALTRAMKKIYVISDSANLILSP